MPETLVLAAHARRRRRRRRPLAATARRAHNRLRVHRDAAVVVIFRTLGVRMLFSVSACGVRWPLSV